MDEHATAPRPVDDHRDGGHRSATLRFVQLLITVVGPRGRPVDAVVAAPTGTTWGRLRDQVARLVDAPADAPAWADGRPLGRDHPLGEPPLLDGAVLHLGVPVPAAAPVGLVELHVVSGPDAGHVVPLRLGRHVVGREPGCDLVLDDVDLSRRHVEVVVTGTTVTVQDLASTNGSRLCGTPVGTSPVNWTAGDALTVGHSRLVLRPARGTPGTAVPDGEGHLLVRRAAGPPSPPAPVVVRLPDEPVATGAGRLPWVAALLPLVVAVPLALLLHQPLFLAFAVMGPVTVLGTALSDRRRHRREHRARVDTWTQERAAALLRGEQAAAEDLRRRREAHPDAAELVTRVLARSLWGRTERPCRVSVGRAHLPSTVTLVDGPDERRLLLDDCPAVVDLAEVGSLAVVGPDAEAEGCARWVLAQLAGTVPAGALSLDVIGAARWGWATWLPQTRPDGSAPAGWSPVDPTTRDGAEDVLRRLEALVEQRRRGCPSGGPAARRWTGPWALLVLDLRQSWRPGAPLLRLLAEGPTYGVMLLLVARHRSELPAECGATLELGPRGVADRLTHLGSGPAYDLVADGISRSTAHRLSRALAPLRTAGGAETEGTLPAQVRLVDLLRDNGTDPTDARCVAARWERAPRSTVALLGSTSEGAWTVDLATDGPHALVGGTTGAGKSELLQTLVASLAVANRPEELGLVLVDYKGGAAFADCAALPHVVGLVTDLDGHLTERALTSLRAEVSRRERLLAEHGAADLDTLLHKATRAGQPARLGRLVIVIDEFRALAEELPDFVDGLVRIAAVGRSLGIHLVLATQRPAGVVSADIKANVNLRIALRVRDAADSIDVIDDPAAAALPASSPGRAFARTGGEVVTAFQTAQAGSAVSKAFGLGVRVIEWRPGAAAAQAHQRLDGFDDHGVAVPTDLTAIVRAVTAASLSVGAERPHDPLLPPLPPVVGLDTVRIVASPGRLPLGLVDRPERQCREPAGLDLAGGRHLAVSGGPRSGRTTLLRTLLGAVATTSSPLDVHVHLLHGGAWRLPGGLPHLGTAVPSTDPHRAVRLLRRLGDLVDERRATLSRTGSADWAGARDHPTADGWDGRDGRDGRDGHTAYQLLLVDGWEEVSAALDEVDHGAGLDLLRRLLRDGPACGVVAVLTGGREVLQPQLACLVPDRWLLRPTDPTEALLAGVASRHLPGRPGPGRAVRVADGAELQVAVLDPATGTSSPAALDDLVTSGPGSAGPPGAPPIRLLDLPSLVTWATLPVVDGDRSRLLVGIGGDGLVPLGVPSRADGPLLVAGPRGSGRTTTLAAVGRSALSAGRRVLTVGSRDTAGLSAFGAENVARGEVGELEVALDGAAGQEEPVVLVDDVDRLDDPVVETALVRWAGSGRGLLVVAGDAARLQDAHRGLARAARGSAYGVLLGPHVYGDGDLLGVRVPPGGDRLPGRGLLVAAGRVTPLQVALPR